MRPVFVDGEPVLSGGAGQEGWQQEIRSRVPQHVAYPQLTFVVSGLRRDQGYDDFPLDVDAWELWHVQGVFILDTLSTGEGSEFELESPGNFAGIFIGKGCIQLQDGSQSYGALFMDGLIGADSCGPDMPLEMDKGDNVNYPHTDLYYSGCVVREVLRATGLGEAAGAGGGVGRVGVRSFSEMLR